MNETPKRIAHIVPIGVGLPILGALLIWAATGVGQDAWVLYLIGAGCIGWGVYLMASAATRAGAALDWLVKLEVDRRQDDITAAGPPSGGDQ